jgi:hypothetical protein
MRLLVAFLWESIGQIRVKFDDANKVLLKCTGSMPLPRCTQSILDAR